MENSRDRARQLFEEQQQKEYRRAVGNMVTRVLRGVGDRIFPPLRIKNDFGDSAMHSVDISPTELKRNLRIVNNQKEGRPLDDGLD
jgi:hypothetical protein